MGILNKLSPNPTDLIDWINGEGFLELDWDYPEDGDLHEAGLTAALVVELTAALEAEYGVEITTSEFKKKKVATPLQLAQLIAEKRS